MDFTKDDTRLHPQQMSQTKAEDGKREQEEKEEKKEEEEETSEKHPQSLLTSQLESSSIQYAKRAEEV